ncbi:MAG: exo-alpha-sialidase, partial [Proteobacteria bacterium]|nr:exo-alpha-sialidase [Pseudomonadota bacterium]
RLNSGRLVLVYSDNDQHWSMEDQIITLLASDDEGKSWFKLTEVDKADLRNGDERLVTPRISLLKDGRLAIIVDHNDFGHFHENQTPGNWIYFSGDDGLNWEGPVKNEIEGFEPDRIIDLPDGRLAVASHLMLADSQEFAVVMTCSGDGGYTWQRESIVAHDGIHRFCEGAMVLYENETKLLCVMRENHSAGIPSFAAFSPDLGKTWSEPKRMPFSFHRPYAKELSNGKIMVTGRNVNGGLGTYAWVGHPEKESGAVVGGPRTRYKATLTDEALVIENSPEDEARYCLLPPESAMSTVFFEAELKIES